MLRVGKLREFHLAKIKPEADSQAGGSVTFPLKNRKNPLSMLER